MLVEFYFTDLARVDAATDLLMQTLHDLVVVVTQMEDRVAVVGRLSKSHVKLVDFLACSKLHDDTLESVKSELIVHAIDAPTQSSLVREDKRLVVGHGNVFSCLLLTRERWLGDVERSQDKLLGIIKDVLVIVQTVDFLFLRQVVVDEAR